MSERMRRGPLYRRCRSGDSQTTFRFVTDGVEAAMQQARAVPGDADIAITGGASTVNQYLAAGLLDELHLHITPFTLGVGGRSVAGPLPIGVQ